MSLNKALLESPVNHIGGGKLANIQILRFFSALAVSLFHVGFLDSLGRNYNVWLVNGVFIFYAISGYVTMLSTERGCGKFMLKRLIKIFPLYWFLTIATFIAMKTKPSLFPYDPTLIDLIKSMFLIPYSHQATATANAMYPIVSMGHTIQTTMLYYLVFWIVAKISYKKRGLLSLFVVIVIMLCGILLKPSSAFMKFYLKPDIIYFTVGIAAYYICKCKISKKNNSNSLLLILAAMLFIATMCFNNRWVLLTLILLLMVFVIQSGKSPIMQLSIFKKLTIMGNWTFSYFLIHLYILRFAEFFGGTMISAKAIVCDLIAIIIAWGISYILYEIIEKRFTNMLKKRLL